jgi:hypothetical protein
LKVEITVAGRLSQLPNQMAASKKTSRTVARARLHLAFAVGTLGANAGLLLGK